MDLPGKRIADAGIYLREPAVPKEYFVEASQIIRDSIMGDGLHLLDVGCAAGAFIRYLTQELPQHEYSGLDTSTRLISAAERVNPAAEFRVGDVGDESSWDARSADVVTMFGTLNCMDDAGPALANLVHWTRDGGVVVLMDMMNPDPIDVLTRYRRAENWADEWERGWNVHSKQSLDRLLCQMPRVREWSYRDFLISIDLPKREDVMRTWTIKTDTKPRQLVNGASQLVNHYFLILRIRDERADDL